MKHSNLLFCEGLKALIPLRGGTRLVSLIFLFTLASISSLRADVITGRVVDKESGEPLEQVQVELLDLRGTTTYIYRTVTDSLGRFTTVNAYGERTSLSFSLIGYHSQKKELMLLGGEKDTLRLDDIRLRLSDILLRNAEVRAKARTFIVRGDTVVFNPQAFRLAEGARLNELISKLPGVTEKDGSLQWMGKPIRILMEGKELFGNTALLTQTLPAEAVERIKAYDKADDLEERTGKKDGKEDYVLDLKIKPGFLERWYGEAETGYETKDKYKVRGDATYLSTHNPLLISFNVANNNRFVSNRTINSYSMSGGGTGGKQQMGAVAYKHAWDRKQGDRTLESYVTADFNMNHTDSWNDNASATEDFMPGIDKKFTHNFSHTWNHMLQPEGRVELSLRPDTLTRVKVEAKARYEKRRYAQMNREGVFTSNPYELSSRPLDALFSHPDSIELLPITTLRSLIEDASRTKSFNGEVNVNYNRQLKRKGEIGMDAYYRYDEQRETSYTDRYFDYFTDTQNDLREHQMGRKPMHHHRFGLSARYRQWWGEKVQFSAGYRSNYRNQTESLNLYDLHLLASAYEPTRPVPEALLKDVLDKGNSYRDELETSSHELNIGWEVNLGKWRLSPSVKLSYEREQTDYNRGKLDTLATRHYWLVKPSMNLVFAPSKTSVWEASYFYDEWMPALYSTLAYYDDTNPLHTSEGNPALRRSGAHRAALSYRANLQKHQQVLRFGLEYGKNVHSISNLVRYNTQTGAYHTKPVHIRGGETWRFRSNYTQYFKEAWEFTNNLSLYMATSYSYLQQTEHMPQPLLNRHRSYEVSEAPRVTYRADAFNVSLGGEYVFRRYDNNAYKASFDQTMSYNANLNAEYRWRSFTFGTDFRLQGNSGYLSPELNRLVPLWNVRAEYKFLRNKAVLKVGFNDLLNKDNRVYGYVNAYSRQEMHRYYRHHYFWASFVYRFDAKKGK